MTGAYCDTEIRQKLSENNTNKKISYVNNTMLQDNSEIQSTMSSSAYSQNLTEIQHTSSSPKMYTNLSDIYDLSSVKQSSNASSSPNIYTNSSEIYDSSSVKQSSNAFKPTICSDTLETSITILTSEAAVTAAVPAETGKSNQIGTKSKTEAAEKSTNITNVNQTQAKTENQMQAKFGRNELSNNYVCAYTLQR